MGAGTPGPTPSLISVEEEEAKTHPTMSVTQMASPSLIQKFLSLETFTPTPKLPSSAP